MSKKNFIIYGSYGYSGNLIAEHACQQGFKPVLAGRDKVKLQEQATRLSLDYFVADANQLDQSMLEPFIAILNCAGPFTRTYKPIIEACLAANTHYLDITGEVEVIEQLSNYDARATSNEIMILPGCGFDVVPSDCLAQHLKSRLTDASELLLAIYPQRKSHHKASGLSRGTAKTMLDGLAESTLMRDEGVLKRVTNKQERRLFTFKNNKQKLCMPITWGDLASAWWSTGIPHIETYMATTPSAVRLFKIINPFRFIFKLGFVKHFIESRINKLPPGPTPEIRKDSIINVLGEASNNRGLRVASVVVTPDGYDFTALSALAITQRVLEGDFEKGFQTPSTAYGKDFVLTLPGVTREDL